jgi:hypothetical protein
MCVLVDIKCIGNLKFSPTIICFCADIFPSVNDSSLNEAFLSISVLGYATYILPYSRADSLARKPKHSSITSLFLYGSL